MCLEYKEGTIGIEFLTLALENGNYKYHRSDVMFKYHLHLHCIHTKPYVLLGHFFVQENEVCLSDIS